MSVLPFYILSIAVLCFVVLIPFSSQARVKIAALDYPALWRSYAQSDPQQEPQKIYPYESCFREAAKANNLPLTLLLALARGESDFNPKAQSSRSCYGIMQIQWPGTAKDLGITTLKGLQDPCTNIKAGARYVRMMMNRYNDDIHLAVAAYNYGPGRIHQGVNGNAIPKGAKWYSGYIYYHLQHVLETSTNKPVVVAATQPAASPSKPVVATTTKPVVSPSKPVVAATTKPVPPPSKRPAYIPKNKLPIILFHSPLLARNFINYFKLKAPTLKLDWFRTSLGETYVVLIYDTPEEKEQGIMRLKEFGYFVDPNTSFF